MALQKKTTVRDIYANRTTKKKQDANSEAPAAKQVIQTPLTKNAGTNSARASLPSAVNPNPALAQAVVQSVGSPSASSRSDSSGKAPAAKPLRPVRTREGVSVPESKSSAPSISIQSGAASRPSLSAAMKRGQTDEMTTIERTPNTPQERAIEQIRLAGSTIRNFVENPVMWASEAMGAAVDSSASGTAGALATVAGLAANVDEYTNTGNAEQLRRAENWLRQGASGNAESSAKYQSEAKRILGNTKLGDLMTNVGVAGMQMYFDALVGGGNAMPSMLVRSFGYGAQDAAEKGFDVNGQVLAGVKSAGVSYISERLFGGNPFYDADAGAVNKLLGRVFGDSRIMNVLASKPADVFYEGLEEVVEDALNPLIDAGALAVTGDDRITVDWPKAEELLNDFVVGSALSAASNVMTGGFSRSQEAQTEQASIDNGAQNAAQGTAGAGGMTTEAQAVQSESSVLNTPQGVQAEQAGQRQRQTTLDIYQNRGTRQQPSRAMQTTLDALSADNAVPIEMVQTIPEVQAAYSHPVADDTSKIDTPERQQLRSQIADELSSRGSAVIDESGNVEYTGTVEQDRQMDIVIGLPAAGKSSAVADPLSQKHHAIVVDSDEAKTRLPEYDNGYGAGAVHEESKAINAEILDRATERGDNIVLPIVGGSYASVMKYISLARENGYTVRLYLNELSSNKAIGRALQRFLSTGRFIRPEILYSYGDSPTEVFNQIISQEGLVDGYEHYSNDVPKGERPQLIRSSDSGRYNTGGVEGDSRTDDIPAGDSRGETASEESRRNDNVSRGRSSDRTEESRRSEINADATADGDGLYGRSVGAATPRRGEQVASRNNLQYDANLSEEGRSAVADAGLTHERISDSLANARAEANIIRDGDGNWLNLRDCMDDLQATIESGGVLSPEQVKLAEKVMTELDHMARDSGDRSVFNEFNRAVVQASKTDSAQSLRAWRSFSDGYLGTVDQASRVLETLQENPQTNHNQKRTAKEADEILRRVSNEVGEAADSALEQIGMDDFFETPEVRQMDLPNLRELIKQSWQDKQAVYDNLMDYLVEHYGMSEQEAQLAANNISTRFYNELAELSSSALHRAFDKKKRGQTDTAWIDKAVEYINMGALTDPEFRDIASEKLFGHRASDEVLNRVSQYAEDAQEMRDAGDIDGLREQVFAISTERGYKPDASIRRILDQRTDVNEMYNLAQSLAVGLAVDQAKPTFGKRLATWQYLSHLYNTRTIIRNVVANSVFAPVDRLSNTLAIGPDFVAAMIRSASEGGTVAQNRTVARQPWGLNRGVSETRRAYVEDALVDNALDINRGAAQGKYTAQNQRLTNRTFNPKGNAWERFNNFREGVLGLGLNVTDAVQKGTTKGQSEAAMRSLMNRGGVMTEEAAQAITESDMLYRSFQRETPLGSFLSIAREGANVVGIGKTQGRNIKTHEFGLGSLVDTYTQVPGALVHTAADYTPLGIVNTALEIYNAIQFNRGQTDAMADPGPLSQQYKGLTNADASVVAQHNAALSIGRMMTGGAIFGLFSYLAAAGAAAVRLYGDDDRDEDETLAAQGVSGFQFNQDAFIRSLLGRDTTWRNGDVIHDLSQYPPVSTIAEIAVICRDEDDDNKFIRILDATARGLVEQFGDLSMVSAAKTVYDDIQYRGDKNAWEVAGDIAGDLIGNSISGMVPGFVRQIAKATDPVMRDTSSDTVLGRAWNRFRSAVPGLRQTLPAKVDYKGEERQYAGNTLTRLLNTFVLPGDVTIYRQDEVVDYITQLSDSTGTSLYADAYAPKKVVYDGESYELNTDARRMYNETYKSAYYDAMEAFMKSDYAKTMPDDMAAEVASGLRALAAYQARREYFKLRGMSYTPENDAYARYDSIGDPALYMSMRAAMKQLSESEGKDNEAFKAVYAQWRTLPPKGRAMYTDGVDGQFDGISTLKKLDNCLQAGMSTQQFYEAKAEYRALSDNESLGATTRRAAFAHWLDTESGFAPSARTAALENFSFTTTLVADEGKYEQMASSGVGNAASERIFNSIQQLQPESGNKTVSDLQRYEAITASGASESEQLAALRVYASDSQIEYFQAAFDNGIALGKWTAVLRSVRESKTGNMSQGNLVRAMYENGIPKDKARAMYNVYKAKHKWSSSYEQAYANAW